METIFCIAPAKFIYVYPTFYLIAVYTGLIIVFFEIYRKRLPLSPMLVILVWGLIFAIIGSKLLTLSTDELLHNLNRHTIPIIHEKVYLGWLIGGMLGIKIWRRIMGFKDDLFDLFAFALPTGFALMRIGCLFGGCCFGKICELPWSITYTQNSPAYNLHLHNGKIQPESITSLPVHPSQIYEIIAMILIIITLFYVKKYLKRPGSLGYTYLLLHSTFRFIIDFTKEGGTYLYGLKLMQWFLLIVIPACALFLFLRERHYKPILHPAPNDSFVKSFAFFLPCLIFLLLPFNWLTPAEFKVLLFFVIVVGINFIIRCILSLSRQYKIFYRIPIALASITVLESSLDTTVTKDTLKNIFYVEIDGGYMKGSYVEICGGVYPYSAGGISLSGFYQDPYNTIFGINIKGFKIPEWEDYALAENFILNHRFFCLDLGAGHLIQGAGDYMDIESYPSLGLRLGPRDIMFIEGEFLKHMPADLPSPLIKLGIGFGTGKINETTVHIGISEAGFYVNPVLYWMNNRLKISPFFLIGSPESYQLNLVLGYRYYFKN